MFANRPSFIRRGLQGDPSRNVSILRTKIRPTAEKTRSTMPSVRKVHRGSGITPSNEGIVSAMNTNETSRKKAIRMNGRIRGRMAMQPRQVILRYILSFFGNRLSLFSVTSSLTNLLKFPPPLL